MNTKDKGEPQAARSVAILALGFGLVGVDRYLIAAMYPLIARELGLGYSAIGIITGSLAFAWGLAALIMGNAADRFGRQRVLVGSLLVFSLLIGASGLATGLLGLIAVRIIMGFADGAFTPASISATIACSKPEHHGRNVGIQQTAHILFGLGLAPLAVTVLTDVVSWRWVFVFFAAPGLLVTWLTARYVVDPAFSVVSDPSAKSDGAFSFDNWRVVLATPNIRLLMALMLCWLTCLITISAFLPSYLIDHLKLTMPQMGSIMAAIGIGAATGALVLSSMSDLLGRKPVILISAIGALAALVVLTRTGAHPAALFAVVFFVQFFNFAGLTLTIGPMCSESVSPALTTTATGLVVACGEILGGGLAPVIAGHFAQAYGIEHVFYLPMGGLALAVLIAFALRETHGRQGSPS